ncbi:uncharacterized protein LOC111026619 isoform X2 [Myzus persicae]|uniref:uncharacterized protein LOC111026619 isoform X2 n=1 Tax=Myzus persicae TaxID=13164 RepID=UPI000B93103C|nr:uncharacterized protein LOC111026619 isoform X2 [Myzus persicae]
MGFSIIRHFDAVLQLITVSRSIVISFSSSMNHRLNLPTVAVLLVIEVKSTKFEIIEAMSDVEDTPQRAMRNELSNDEKPKHRKQKYRCEWESDKLFKGWLKPEKNNSFKAKCIKCQVSFISELSSIKKHATSKGHENAVKATKGSQNIVSTFISNAQDPIADKVKTAEIKLCGLLAEHNCAFLLVDHLIPLLKEIFPDSAICQKMKLKRTKATNIIKNVIAPAEKQILCDKLNISKFSIMVDESTDIACQSTMCVVVRFYDHESKIVVSRFWELLQVFDIKNLDTVD